MGKLYALTTKIVSILGYPVQGLILHNTRRVRTLVIFEDVILLQRSSIGNQKWNLPGGGIGKGENAMDAAIRETFEETGVMIPNGSITCIGEERLTSNGHWPVIDAVFYKAVLKEIQPPRISRPHEILEVRWFPLSNLPNKRSMSVERGLALSRS